MRELLAGIVLGLCAIVVRAAGSTPSGLQVERLANPKADITVQTLLQSGGEQKFIAVAQAERVVLPTAEPHNWLRLHLTRDLGAYSAPVLTVHHLGPVKLNLYLPPNYAPMPLALNDNEADALSASAGMVALPRELSAGAVLILEAEPGTRRLIRLGIAERNDFAHAETFRLRCATAMEIALLVVMLMVFSYWLLLRDRMSLYYVGYVGALLPYLMLTNGDAMELPILNTLASLGPQALGTTGCIAYSFAIAFALPFAGINTAAPKIAMFLRALLGAFLLLGLAQLIATPWGSPWFSPLANLLVVTTTILLLSGATLALRKHRYAGLFLVGWIPLSFIEFARSLQALDMLAYQPWRESAYGLMAALQAVILSLGLADRTLTARRERDDARVLAAYDPLTGVLNRRAGLERLNADIERARRTQSPLTLLFIDVDHFKLVNDSFGHAVGDACLRSLARQIERELRDDDAIARFGGDEFLVIMPGVGAAEASEIAEKLRALVQRSVVEIAGLALKLTISVGITEFRAHHPDAHAVIAAADAALYQSKRSGRNCVSGPGIA